MWIWIIVVAVIIGAIIGFFASDGDSKGADTAQGAMAGGCMAVGCLGRIALVAITIMIILWLFGKLFG